MRLLYTRIYLHMLGVLAVVAALTAAVFATGFRQAYFRNFTERLVRHEAAELAAVFDRPGERSARARSLSSDLEVDITLRDADGKVAAVAGHEELPPLSSDELSTTRSGATSFTHRNRGWYAVAPVLDPLTGRLRGTVQAAPLRRARPPSLLRPALTLALILLIVAIASAPLARRISRPVERLTQAMRRFGGGDLGYRVPVGEPADGVAARGVERMRRRMRRHHRSDELAELTTSWNEMADRIERLVRGQKELLANVSHELRSPLARIRVALELLPRDASSETRIQDLEGDLGELERLIDDVLTASRLEAVGLPARVEVVSIAPLLAQLADRARIDPATAGKSVLVVASEPAPPSTVLADGALIKRALWNLIENAAKYGAPPITLSASLDAGRLVLSVRDEGPGIPAAERERVFSAFFRADKARTPGRAGESARGFGLGLTIARRVAEVHGGTIVAVPARVEAGIERGCEMRLVLPLAPPPTARAEGPATDRIG